LKDLNDFIFETKKACERRKKSSVIILLTINLFFPTTLSSRGDHARPRAILAGHPPRLITAHKKVLHRFGLWHYITLYFLALYASLISAPMIDRINSCINIIVIFILLLFVSNKYKIFFSFRFIMWDYIMWTKWSHYIVDAALTTRCRDNSDSVRSQRQQPWLNL